MTDRTTGACIRGAVGDGSDWGLELTHLEYHGTSNVLACSSVASFVGASPVVVQHGDVLLRERMSALERRLRRARARRPRSCARAPRRHTARPATYSARTCTSGCARTNPRSNDVLQAAARRRRPDRGARGRRLHAVPGRGRRAARGEPPDARAALARRPRGTRLRLRDPGARGPAPLRRGQGQRGSRPGGDRPGREDLQRLHRPVHIDRGRCRARLRRDRALDRPRGRAGALSGGPRRGQRDRSRCARVARFPDAASPTPVGRRGLARLVQSRPRACASSPARTRAGAAATGAPGARDGAARGSSSPTSRVAPRSRRA